MCMHSNYPVVFGLQLEPEMGVLILLLIAPFVGRMEP